MPSIFDLPPLENGGIPAQLGFDYQKHVAARFCVQMLVDDSLKSVWCELHDDVMLVWERDGKLSVEFVQVKSNDHRQSWSVALLTQRKKNRVGSSILEKSLANDRASEPCTFRIVTATGVDHQLDPLTLTLGNSERMGKDGTLAGTKYKGIRSPNGTTVEQWFERLYWQVIPVPEFEAKRDLSAYIEHLGFSLGLAAVDKIYDEIMRLVHIANNADSTRDRSLKRIEQASIRLLVEAEADSYRPSSVGVRRPSREEVRRVWKAYTEKIVEELRRPFFGAEILGTEASVSDLYIPIRYFPADSPKAFDLRRNVGDIFDPRIALENQLQAQKDLEDWLNAEEEPDIKARLIQGNPGSGKSTLVKKVVEAHLQSGRKAVFIPLQRLQFKNAEEFNLPNAIDAYLKKQEGFTFDPLALTTEESPLLIVLDGLDELALIEEGINDSQRTISQTVLWQAGDEAEEKPYRILVTSRFMTASQTWQYHRKFERYELMPFYYPFVKGMPEETLATLTEQYDYRLDWWQRFGELIHKPYPEVPSIVKSPALEEAGSEPLTSILIGISHADVDKGIEIKNPSELYLHLLDVVFRRAYDPQKSKTPETRFNALDFTAFERIMQDVAISAWPQGGRITSLDAIKAQMIASGNEALYERFVNPANVRLPSVLLLSYFREIDERLFEGKFVEFTHKSICDFLVARHLTRQIFEGKDASLEETLTEVLSQAELTPEHLEFFLHEIHKRPNNQIKEAKNSLQILFDNSLRSPTIYLKYADLMRSDPYSEPFNVKTIAATRCRNIWILLNIVHSEFIKRLPNDKEVWSDNYLFISGAALDLMLSRPYWTDILRSHLRRVSPRMDEWIGLDLSGVNMQDSYLTFDASGSIFNYANLNGSKWHEGFSNRGVFTNCSFIDATVEYGQFTDCDFRSASFHRATIRSCRFSACKFHDADFSSATISGCTFAGSYLRECAWQGCTIHSDNDFTEAIADEGFLAQVVRDETGQWTNVGAMGWILEDRWLKRAQASLTNN